MALLFPCLFDLSVSLFCPPQFSQTLHQTSDHCQFLVTRFIIDFSCAVLGCLFCCCSICAKHIRFACYVPYWIFVFSHINPVCTFCLYSYIFLCFFSVSYYFCSGLPFWELTCLYSFSIEGVCFPVFCATSDLVVFFVANFWHF